MFAALLLLLLSCAGGSKSRYAAVPASFGSAETEGLEVLAADDGGGAHVPRTRPTPSRRAETSTAGDRIDRKLVRTAWLTFEVDGEEEQKRIVRQGDALAQRFGGYVASEHGRGMTLKVPSEHLAPLVEALEGVGEVTERSVNVHEVTEQYYDLSTRIRNARRLKERLLDLLARAQSVNDVLSVEKELARVTQELDLLEGRMRVLSQQVAYSTVDVSFTEAVSPGPVGWVFYGLYRGIKWLFVWD